MSKTLARLLLGALAVALVAACGGSPSSSTGSSAGNTGFSGNAGGGVAKSVTAPAVNGSLPAVKGGAPQDSTIQTLPADVVPPIGEGPRVIRTAQVAVEVRNGAFDSTVDKLFTLSTSLGGYISGSVANSDSGSLRTGTITFQVPANKFTDAITAVRALGTVQNLAIGGQDVSLQYVDLQTRLKNEEAQRDAMLAILQQAKTVGEIIQVQTQIGQITGQIEQLKGQIAYYDHATSFSTISVSVHEAAVAARPVNNDSWGFATALSQGLHGFVSTLNYILVGVGYVGPVLLLIVLGFVAFRLRRRLSPVS
jgi:hypothetical protein